MGNYVAVNLQLFADSKTEQPTPKRRREAREKGQLAKSQEITSSLLLLFLFSAIGIIFPNVIKKISDFIVAILTNEVGIEFTPAGVEKLVNLTAETFIDVTWPIFLVAFVVAFLSTFMQVGVLFTSEPLKIKLSRLNPIEGFKRILSLRSLVELTKALGKLSIVVFISYITLGKEIASIDLLLKMPISSSAQFIGTTSIKLGTRIAMALIFIGAGDYAYQWWDHEKNLRMSKEEVKEEFKQTEGNPEIRSRQRELQRSVSQRRMMEAVPQADVVITNPTHYAVALKYDPELAEAPVVIAKGVDYIATKIKQVATSNEIPLVEDVYVAQSLYRLVEIGDQVPEELYQAVAEILAFVYRSHKMV